MQTNTFNKSPILLLAALDNCRQSVQTTDREQNRGVGLGGWLELEPGGEWHGERGIKSRTDNGRIRAIYPTVSLG